MSAIPAVAILLLATTTAAQGAVRFISPLGAEFFEGNSSSDIMLGNWAANTRTQQIDNNLTGAGRLPLVRFLGWRRNGSANAGAAKTTDLTVIMSHADYAAVGATFASNYKTSPTTVFTRKPVMLPDWNAPSGSAPSPCDVVLMLDVPFAYNGTDALLYDVLNENNPLGVYGQDWVSVTTHTYGDYPRELGGGCTTGNGAMLHRCAARANATLLELGFKVTGAPASAALVAMLGVTDPNAAVPGLCGVLHTLPLVTLPIGSASATGGLNDAAMAYAVSAPWNPGYAGAVLFTQVVGPDPGQAGIPLAMSNGLGCAMPAAGGPHGILVKRIYHTSSTTAPVGTGPAVSAVPTMYGF